MDSVGEGEGGKIWENGIETCIISCMKRVASPGSMHDTGCLYIFEISCLSVASFAIIFSHSEGCLFTLLIVSFDVQKLLRLVRSHLFIFAFISNILGGGS